MTNHSYKLIYYDLRGRAELSRLLFHAAGVPFDDVRLTEEEIQAKKPSFPFGKLPLLMVDDLVCGQSLAIASYLAMEFGYYGKTNLESLKIGEIFFHVADVFDVVSKWYHENDVDRKKQFLKEAQEVELPKALGYLEKLLQKSETGFFVGSEMTLADIAVFDICTTMEECNMLEIAKCPDEIQKLVEKVSLHPKLINYVLERK